MPRYEFVCDGCGCVEEFIRSIREGPPKDIDCSICFEPMRHVMACNFILKGTGWPGKDAKSREYAVAKSKETCDAEHAEQQRDQRLVDEVLEVRRKGRKATDTLKRDNPQKWKDYSDALKRGARGTKKYWRKS